MRRCIRIAILLMLISCAIGQEVAAPAPSAPSQDPAQMVQFLTQTISWYRQLGVEQQLATEPADLSFFQENRRVADQVVQLAFDYARIQAQTLAKRKAVQSQSQAESGSQYQRLTQIAQQADQQIQDTQQELEAARAKVAGSGGSKRKEIESQIAELESEIGLLQARRDAIQNMAEFVSSSRNGGGGMGLRAQIEELARSVPASLSHPEGTGQQTPTSDTSSSLPSGTVARKPEPTGIWGLTTDLIHLSGKIRTLDSEIASTRTLSDNCKEFRKPVLDYLRGLIKQGDQLFAAADTANAAQLAQQKQQLDSLTSQFKQTSAGMLPLSKIVVLLDIYQRTLESWRASVNSDAGDELRQLGFRVGVLLVLIAVVIAVGEIWRRTTFRYVRDARRRYQFLLLRRVVMWAAIILIIVLTFATQLGSAVTFAGLITAGVAVALQNVIVSVVAYFFLIGKYGIRVGDRVQIAGVNGEVVDIGLVRIHVMELGGPGTSQPTGRIVAFSNSIVFQPTAGIFKQIPGTNFVWHELKLTLASETDFRTAKERLTQAAEEALSQYREDMELQRQGMERNLNSVTPAQLKARVRLHYSNTGIEASVMFPVEIEKASEMDDHVMREVMAALEREPRLKLLHAEMPTPTAVG